MSETEVVAPMDLDAVPQQPATMLVPVDSQTPASVISSASSVSEKMGEPDSDSEVEDCTVIAKPVSTVGHVNSLEMLLERVDAVSRMMNHSHPTINQHPKIQNAENARRAHNADDEDEELMSHEEEDEADWPTRMTEQPSLIAFGKMRDYQIEALNWMISLHDAGAAGILADEMGLGKTLETISLIAYLYEFRNNTGPHLVLVPLSTLGNWQREFKRWCPTVRTIKLHGSKDERKVLNEEFKAGEWDVCLTSYEMALKEKSMLSKVMWEYCIIDEAHRIKNENSLLSQVVRIFTCRHRLLITGTPLQNNLKELWALLNYLLPDMFDSYDSFSTIMSGEEDTGTAIKTLHRILRPFLLRRLKSEVETALKPKIEMNLYVGMTELQTEYYRKVLSNDLMTLQGNEMKRARLLNLLMQVRKASNHPYLFEGAEPGPPYFEGEHLVQNSGKMMLLDKLLTRLKSQGSRVLIFSQMTRVLDILEDYCYLRGYKFCRIDGATSQMDREERMEQYNSPDSEQFIFLLSTRAGGLGINLQTADIVIFYDSDWNPQMDLQAQDRAHRIGQKKQVYVYRLISEGTIDESVVKRAQSKLFLDTLVIQQGRRKSGNSAHKLGSKEVFNMVRMGAEDVFQKDSTWCDEDIDAIFAKGRDRTQAQNDEIKSKVEDHVSIESLNFDGNYESSSLYEFEGEDFKGAKTLNIPKPKTPDQASRRTTVKTYDEKKVFQDMMGFKATAPKVKRLPNFRPTKFHDFRFFKTPDRILELEERQFYSSIKDDDGFLEGWKDTVEFLSFPGEKRAAILKKVFVPLTKKEEKELDKLRSSGFPSWKRSEYQAFVRACAAVGRQDIEGITEFLPEKTVEEVKAFSDAFWKRYKQVDSYAKDIDKITRGEKELAKNADMRDAIKKKMKKYAKSKNPIVDVQIPARASSSSFTDIADRFLLVKINELGFGNWEELRWAVRASPLFCFDWYIRSKTPGELKNRCELLAKLCMNEKPEPKKRGRSGSKTSASSKKKSKTN